jgi:hypothetical protein
MIAGMHLKLILGTAFALLVLQSEALGGRQDSPLVLRGYVKGMPAIRFDRDFRDASFLAFMTNRLNAGIDLPWGLHIAAEGRNRLFYNEQFRDIPGIKEILEQDPGFARLSWVWMDQGGWIGHSDIDRLYLDWRGGSWQVRAGRQRINWGVNLVSNPNDLFNNYSFFDFDYEERPGTDALRVQYHSGFASRVELAYSPSKQARESTAAMLWATNHKGYDLQVLAGYYRHRSALGLGWAGSIGMAGFKGEATWFYDLEGETGVARGNVVAATGLDYMFPAGTFVVAEFLYNGGYGRRDEGVFLITQPLRADNIMFSKFAATLSVQHPFSSLLGGGLALMGLPDIGAGFIMPSLSWSVMTNLDMEIVGQVFAGGKGSLFEEAGSSCFVSLQYSF